LAFSGFPLAAQRFVNAAHAWKVRSGGNGTSDTKRDNEC
jgi:hypothetical protein